ncbi:hypothetical protein AOB60_21070 [Streptomyces noursei]|uniref:Uncharacterized protein n=1 Tax=Streptomyces noursei TaxID=1971 RepID=A0A2N8P7G1_STRNR|nr:hypothetical protein AOB60_21070 [Streptomyces noursei]
MFQAFEYVLGVSDQVLSGRGECDPAPCPLQQGHSCLAFQQGQLLGDRGWAERQCLGDGGDGASVREFPEQT